MVRTSHPVLARLLAGLVAVALAGVTGLALAAQRTSPGWWDPDGIGNGADWHYRVAVNLPATSAINSTAKADVDFAALMAQLGISGTFDPNSVRVVRPGGTLAAVQEYNDAVYAGATDSIAARGELRWIVQDPGAQTYHIYFDIAQNGAKAANPQPAINGNFEHSVSGAQLPAGWTSATKLNAALDMQVRPSETVTVTDAAAGLDNPFTTDGTARTGGYSYLIGARTNEEAADGAAQTVLVRTISVPAVNPGNLELRWRPEGWDSEWFDNLTITITSSGGAVTTLVGNSLGAYTTYPNSPNIGSNPVSNSVAGYGQYNGFDMDTTGIHHNGMTVAQRAQPWFSRSVSLAAYAGQTVTVQFSTGHATQYKSWFHIDDLEWSVVAGTVGPAEGFGAALTAPLGNLVPGQPVRVLATMDAQPTGSGNPVTADVYYPDGSLFMAGAILHNDGAHGDGAAGDAAWGSGTLTVPLDTPAGTGWTVRLFARDASTSTLGSANNGLVHRSGLPNPQVMANWWNIDERTFAVIRAVMNVTKTSAMIADGVSALDFKTLPGGTVQYCLTIGNSGNADASTVIALDSLPGALNYVPGSMRSGADCASAATIEDDDSAGADESDPVGASRAGATLTIQRALLTTGTSFAVTYQATIN